MRILILTPRVPWTLLDGGRIAMARLALSLAAAGAEVRVLSLNPRKHRASIDDAPLPTEAIDIDTSRVAGPAVRALASRTPFVVARFVSRAYRARIRHAIASFRPDVVQIESPFLLPYHDNAIDGATTVLRSLNVEFRIWEELAREEERPLRRFALQRVAASLRAYETRHLDTCDALVPISREDAAEFRALGCTRPIHVAPCGITLPPPHDGATDATVGFIGSLDFRPNQKAVLWILDELWPRVVQKMPEARLRIAGSGAPEWLRARVDVAQVASAEEFMRASAVTIAPLFSGGGMRIKVLEAMALGCAIVATTRGAGGIDATSGRDVVIENDAEAFANAVVTLLRDGAARRRLGEAARATVAARYDADAIGRDLLAFYASLRSGTNASTSRANNAHRVP